MLGRRLKTPEPMPLTHRPVAPGDHVFLVDGSSFVFRAYFQSIRQDQKLQRAARSAACRRGAAVLASSCFRFIREGAAGGDAHPSRHHLPINPKTRSARRFTPPTRAIATSRRTTLSRSFPLMRRGGARLRPHPHRAGPLRGRRPHRHLRQTSVRARRRRAHRLRRQRLDATHRPACVDV